MAYRKILSMSREKSVPRNPHLDFLRGLAILGVVSIHSGLSADYEVVQQGGKLYPEVTYLISLGKYGVELFFFISGYLLYSIYMTESPFILARYFKRRMGRIYPLWLIFLVLAISRRFFWESGNFFTLSSPQKSEFNYIDHNIVIFAMGALFLFWVSESLWNAIIPGGWSIQAEVGHYLIFPILRKISNLQILRYSFWVNLMSSLIYFSLPSLESLPRSITIPIEAWIRLNLYATFGYFFLGILAAQLSSKIKEELDLKAAIYEMKVHDKTFAFWLASFLLVPLSFGKQIEALGFLILCLLCSYGFSKVSILRLVLNSLGRYSYFIYFAHFLILELISFSVRTLGLNFNFYLGQIVAFGCILTITLATSWVLALPSHKYFESFFIRLSHR